MPSSAVTVVPHTWIELADGARLGARLWLPAEPAPAVLEYIPYRKDDATYNRDATLHPHLAEHGYACVRVDMRGSGSSDGVLLDEYSDQETSDGEEVVNWIASQPWCDGNVAMIGISWGGITGLQVASRQPEALKAVIALGSTDSRYYDDGGYYMGCMVGQTIGWAAIMLGYNTRPPDPLHVGSDWRDLWMRRLNEAPMFLGMWLEHQREDEYWMRGTVASDYAAIHVPVLAVSGHADCWPNTVSRLMANLSGPRMGIQGAWSHRYPQMAIPGPAIDFLPEVVRWFDHWLKGAGSDLAAIPQYRVFLQDGVRPATYYDERPGRWLGFETWPSPDIERRLFRLDGELSSPNNSICSAQSVGLSGGEYMPWFNSGPGPELPDDQRIDDAGSVCFDSRPLIEELPIVGNPVLQATVSIDAQQGLIAARLCDVAPDGSSTFITKGILNLSHRHSKSNPTPMTPGQPETVEVELDHVGYCVPEGHRLRLAVSSTYWPIAWPSPTAVTLSIDPSESEIDLPVWSGNAQHVSFDLAPEVAGADVETLRVHREDRSRRIDPQTGGHHLDIEIDNGRTRIAESGLEMDSGSSQRYSIHPSDPLTAEAHYSWRWAFARGDWNVETVASTRMWCTATTFEVEAQIIASEGGKEVFRRPIRKSYDRDHF